MAKHVTFAVLPRLRLCTATCAAAGLLVGSCVTLRPDERTSADSLTARVQAVLARRGLGPDALSVIDNILRHEAQAAPLGSPLLVRELLARPPDAADAAKLFYRTVPGALRRLVEEASRDPPVRRDGPPVPIRGLLDVYLGELAEAQALLRSTPRGSQIDAQAIIRELNNQLPSRDALSRIATSAEQATIDRAVSLFLNATGRFVRALRASDGNIQFPDKIVRFDSVVGVVSIGTRGDDVHGPEAAVIIDPGGNDTYERSPTTGGAISVIVDLGGDDRYRGSDVVVHGLSAIIDFSGNDRYTMTGPGLGAAIAGVSVIVDFAGDDSYEADVFGEGAAAFGLGAVIDLLGNDTYALRAGGQGLGLAGGVGLLWDLAGNDTYTARGLSDVFNRGGGVSAAQGAAFGFRTMLGGGVGILRDDSGDDLYQAEMFAQGMGFYYGVGLLWDGGGEDRYQAVRYAQGNGVHEAVGVLRDESGNDRYELSVGVGQGMGLDLAVGLLRDGAGDDSYRAQSHAQGSATANGMGILSDSGGADEWHMSSDRSWGRAEWLRGLPSVGLLLYDPSHAAFARDGKPMVPPGRSADLGGPLGDSPVAHEPASKPHCSMVAAGAPAVAEEPPLAEALRSIVPGFTGGAIDLRIYADVLHRLTTELRASVSVLPSDDFNVTYSLSEALRCAFAAASTEAAEAMWTEMEHVLAREPATSFAGVFAGALRDRPAGTPQMLRILTVLDDHPRCSARAAALSLRSALSGDGSRATIAPHAQAALRSPCWRLQAAALAALERLGAAPDAGAPLASFLRRPSGN